MDKTKILYCEIFNKKLTYAEMCFLIKILIRTN